MPIEQKAYDSTVMGGVPYYDDFDQQKKFLKMLFKPGLPVQARELTQAQTILQNQIERFGSYVFRNGSVVLGGGVSTSSANFVRLSEELPLETLKRLVNQKVRVTKGDGSNVDAIVCGYADKSSLANDAFQIVFLKYTTVGEYESGERVFTIGEGNIGVEFNVLSGSTPGSGFVQTFVTVDQGVFFIDGYFCLADAQSAAATTDDTTLGYRTFLTTTSSVGFKADKTVVDPETDTSLRDPSFGFNNFNAPGADRFKIELILESRELSGDATDSNSYTISDPVNFFELVRVIQGQVTKKIKYPELAELEKTLARRTFDESGNYTVSPFEIEVGTHEEIFGVVDENKFGVKLSPGKAYVSGFEFETIAPTFLTVDKTTSTLTTASEYQLSQGSFFSLKGSVRETDFDGDNTSALIEGITLDGFINETINLFTDGNPVDILDDSDNVIGSCVPTHLLFDNTETTTPARLYFHSRTMTAPDNQIRRLSRKSDGVEIFGIACNFSSSGDDTIVTQNAKRIARVSGSGSVSQLLNPVRWTTIKAFKGTANANGVVGFTSGIGSKDFLATIGVDSDNAQIRPVGLVNLSGSPQENTGENNLVLIKPNFVPSIDNSKSSIDLDFGTNCANRQITCFLPMNFESVANIRKKTLSGNTNVTVNAGDELTTQNVLSLGFTDVKEIVKITQVDDLLDVTNKFNLNTGQTDFTYENSTIELKDPLDPDIRKSSDFTVTLKRFLHSGDGPFTKDSYVGVKASELDATGSEGLSPFDILDFRPINSSGNYTQGTGQPSQTPFFTTALPSFATVSSFLPRIDSVVLTKERKLLIVQGFPDNEPQPPRIASGDLELYRIRINGADSDAQSLQVENMDSQRFTMSQINELENRTTDDFVENYKKNIISNMVARGNAAFADASVNEDDVYIDDLLGYENVDAVDEKCNVSFDPIRNQLRPAFRTTAVTQFDFDGENPSTGVTFSSDGIALSNFSEPAQSYIVQNFTNSPASSVNINPFGINDYLGKIKLTPHRAKYWSETKRARVTANIRGELNSYESDISSYDNQGRRLGFGTVFRDWEVFWCGVEERERDIVQNTPSNRVYKAPKKSATIKRILTEKVKKIVSNRVVDLSIRPYLDTFTLRGVVENVLPGATYNLFFDGVQQNLDTEPFTASGQDAERGGGGTFEFTTVIPADTFTIGKKLVRVVSGSPTNSIVDCSSSADEIFHGEGFPDVTLFGDNLVRPVTLRRKAANVEEIADEYFSDVFETSNSTLVNALNPVSQTFNVDAELYPNGVFINKIDLWFTRSNKDVMLKIHPTRAGNPLTSVVMPFSEVSSVSREAEFTTSGLVQSVIDTSSTPFEFTTPVYLPAGEYSISVSTNDTDAEVVTYDETSGDAPIRPTSMLKLYLPQNDGSVVGYQDQYLACNITKCAFDVAVGNNFDMSASITENTPIDSIFVSANPPIVSTLDTSVSVRNGDDLIVNSSNTNTTIDSINFGGRKSAEIEQTLNFTINSDGDVSTVVDTESVAMFVPSFDINEASTPNDEEVNDAGSASHFRYYSKVVETDSILDGMVVSLDGLFRGLDDLRVFIRRAKSDENIFTNNFEELFVGNDSTKVFNPEDLTQTFARQFTGDDRFTRYQIKVVGQRAEPATGRSNPFITFLGAAPTRSAGSFTASGGFTPTISIPTGTIMPYFGDPNADILSELDGSPAAFLLCNGQSVENGVYETLFSALQSATGQNPPAGTDPNTFKVPDLRGRTTIGAGTGTGLTQRDIGTNVGSEEADISNLTLTATAKIGVDGTGSGTTSVFSSDAIINSADEVSNTNTSVIDITSSGSGGAAGNVQPSFVVNYIIKT